MKQHKFKVSECSHKNAYHFHNNAPEYCPDCGAFIDGKEVVSMDDVAFTRNLNEDNSQE